MSASGTKAVSYTHLLEQVPEGAGTVRHRQAPGGVPLPGQILPLFRRQPPAPPVIHRLSIRAVGGGSRHPLRPGAEAGIDQPLLLQLPEGRLIGRGPPALVHRLDVYKRQHTERGQCMLKAICEKLGFDSLGYQSLEGLLESIGLDRDKVCTYCWNGRE